MSTFGTLQAQIADDLTRDDLSLQIKKAINDAIKTWEGRRLFFNEKLRRIDTIASQEYYDLSKPTIMRTDGSDADDGELVLEIDDISITVANEPYSLTPRTQQWMNEQQALPSQYIGQPDSYAVFGNQIRLYPVPDQVYELTLSCLLRLGPSPLVNEGDTNEWMTEGEPLIRFQAIHSLCRWPLRDAEGMAAAKDGIAQAEFELGRKTSAKVMVGSQRAWQL